MALSDATSWRKVIKVGTVTALCSAYLLSGCSMYRLDSIRPEVNGERAMVVDPDILEESIGGSLSSDLGSDNTEPPPNIPDMDYSDITEGVVPGEGLYAPDGYTTETLPSAVLSSTSYSRYLSTFVVKEIESACAELEASPWGDLYFHVMHAGYNPIGATDSLVMEPGAPYDYKNISTGSIGGFAISEFAYNYLVSLDGNNARVTSARNQLLNKINQSGLDVKTNWLSGSSSGRLTKEICAMWGNPRLSAESSIQKYLQSVRASAIGTIPNLSLSIQTVQHGSSKTSVVLNVVPRDGSKYQDNVSGTALSRIFTSCNQYSDHRPTRTFDELVVDDNCMLWCDIDGWSKTIVVLGCENGKTLQELLGNKYHSVKSIFDSIYSNKEWALICALEGMENASTIASGARGVV